MKMVRADVCVRVCARSREKPAHTLVFRLYSTRIQIKFSSMTHGNSILIFHFRGVSRNRQFVLFDRPGSFY